MRLVARRCGDAYLMVNGIKVPIEIREPAAELTAIADGELGAGEVSEPVQPGPGSLLVKLGSLPFLEFFHDPETASDLVRLLQSQRLARLRGDTARAAELQPRVDQQLAHDRERWTAPEQLDSYDLIAAAESLLVAGTLPERGPVLKALRDFQTADPQLQARLLFIAPAVGRGCDPRGGGSARAGRE